MPPSPLLDDLSGEKQPVERTERQPDSVETADLSQNVPSGYVLDPEREKKLLRKMDLRILPILTLLYLLSFIDRGNIGNAKIEGLAVDLNLTDGQYNWCLTGFFLTYCALEVPCNIVLKRLRPSLWLPGIMVAWGIVMTLMGLVQNFAGLLTARCFLGVAEAGLFPGVTWYLTLYYRRYEFQWRMAIFFSAVGIAGAFSGLLAYGISFMDGTAGLEGWRWIFILEGIVTVVVATLAFFLIYDSPETAAFLSEDERRFVVYRLKYQYGSEIPQSSDFRWSQVQAAFMDWQVWAGVGLFWGIVAPLYGISLFLPQIISDLGYKTTTAQLLTVPIYVFASMVSLVTAWFSDRAGRRSPFILPLMLVILVGFIMCISSARPGVVYAGIFIAAAGVYGAYPGNIALISNNLAGESKRAVGMAIHIGCGNLSGAAASNFYRGKDKPRYILGHALEIGFVCLGVAALLILVLNYRRINMERARKVAAGEHRLISKEKMSEQGDRAVTFRYML